MKSWLILFLILFTSAMASAEDDFSLCDSALSQVGLTCEDLRFDQDEMANWGGDLWRLHYFTMFHQNPLKLPKYGELNLKLFSDNVKNVSSLLAWAGARIDCPIRRSLIGDQLQKYVSSDSLPLPSITQRKRVFDRNEFILLRNKLDFFYRVIDDSSLMFASTIHEMEKQTSRQKLFDYFTSDSEEPNYVVEELMPHADLNRMIAGAEDIADAVKKVADSLEYASFPPTKTEISTSRGLIVVGTSGNDDYGYSIPPLMIIDGGGDDVYRFSGYPNKFPLTVIIDVAGNDRYLSPDSTQAGIGGAVMGMTMLVDKAGDDLYQGVNISQGAGIFGVGIMMDYTGNDVYSANTYSQGVGAFGVGILSDSSGADSLYCFTLSQGAGYTKGCGLLVNYEGDDRYVADDSIILNPAQQSDKHNTSLAQGFGFGKRADYIDGHSWAGGVGVLCDVKGDDYYSCGIFGQGGGYWYAVGMLLDGEGNDFYNSAWYTMGSGAHFAVGYLDDFKGNDVYNSTMNMSIGSGHDFTIGFFNEREGNDIYYAVSLSLGGGNADGMGFFFDHQGDDVYHVKGGTVLGQVNPLRMGARELLDVFGVFIDGGGNDLYDKPWPKNNSRWISPHVDTTLSINPHEIGVGIDR